MSIPVAVPGLAEAMSRYAFAYLLTVTDDARVHAVAVAPTIQDGELTVDGLGARSLANAAARPSISLVWPPAEAGEYSLIVDGDSSAQGVGHLAVRPTRAVLHRQGVPSSRATAPTGCGSDCVPLDLTL